MKLWRTGTETRDYKANDLSGAGAAKRPGRWNDTGVPVLYTATSIALAVLETAAYVPASGFPLNRYIVEIDLPTGVWQKRKKSKLSALPGGWDAVPAGRASIEYGMAWVASSASALLLVPSVIVPEEYNVLINPAHPDARLITATTGRRYEYDLLFR